MKPNKLFILACLSFGLICSGVSAQPGAPASNEIIYHIFQRSFYDSNGDYHGDLNGIRQKLDYLQELGVTSILLTRFMNLLFTIITSPLILKRSTLNTALLPTTLNWSKSFTAGA